MRLLTPMILLAFAAACGPPPEPPPPPPPPPVDGDLVIGGGADNGAPGFIELSDGQDVALIPGSQAGFHVFFNARVPAGAMTSEYITLERTARRKDTGELVSRNTQRVRFFEGEVSGFEDTEKSIPLFLCPTPVGIAIMDQPLILRFSATDDNGNPSIEGQLEVVPRCQEALQPDFCRQICNG